MLKTWTRKLPSGASIVYSYCENEAGVAATALVKKTGQIYSATTSEPWTKDEVERLFEPAIRRHRSQHLAPGS